MSTVIDPSGTQVLPPAENDRQVISSWTAVQCCSADQRTKHVYWRLIAARLVVLPAGVTR